MSEGGDFFDNEFGSASANDIPWETIRDPASNMMPFSNGPTDAPSPLNDFSLALDEDFNNSSNAPTDVATVASSNVPGSTVSAYTPPFVSMEASSMDIRRTTTTSTSSRRESLENSSSNKNEWNTEHEKQLEQKREAEERFKEECRKEAQQQLADWYKEREERLQKNHQQNRISETQESNLRLQDKQPNLVSNSKESWARVCELVELGSDASSSVTQSSKLAAQCEAKTRTSRSKNANSTLSGSPPPKQSLQPIATKDTSRMKELLLQLKAGNISMIANSVQLSNGI